VMLRITIIIIICICSTIALFSVDDGFSLLFENSRDVFTDKPLIFENPLPKWLRGSLVSFVAFSFVLLFCFNRFTSLYDS